MKKTVASINSELFFKLEGKNTYSCIGYLIISIRMKQESITASEKR